MDKKGTVWAKGVMNAEAVGDRGASPDIKLMIVDDHALFRRGLLEVLEGVEGLKVVAEAGSAQEALEMAARIRPDLILMDIEMGGSSGIDATRYISQLLPETQIVMLTVSSSDRHLFEAIKAGAVGYLTKDVSPDVLVEAIRGASLGAVPMSPRMATRMLSFFKQSTGYGQAEPGSMAESLTAREEEVLGLIARGLRDRDIAQRLGVAEATVKKHVQNMLRKLHVRNRREAAFLVRPR